MPPANPLAAYLRNVRDIHATGAAVKETSYYGPLANLLNAVGGVLKSRVSAVINLRNAGAGIPDGSLFTAEQFGKGEVEPQPGQLPARGALEVKGCQRMSLWSLGRSRRGVT